MRGQLGPAQIHLEDLAADELFEPVELKAYGRLRPVKPRGDTRHAAFLHQQYESSQQRQIQ
jgi:hypothetical protein